MKERLERINDFELLLPKGSREGMNTDAKVIANKAILDSMEDEAVMQLTNVAMLPGVVEPVVGLPDMHIGYGLPMGSVAAFDTKDGIISAGLCGFDINCGINLIRTNLTEKDVEGKKKELISSLYNAVPVGVGGKGRLRVTDKELLEILTTGLSWAVEHGYGTKEDIENTEENGCMEGGDPSKVSALAKKRGSPQLGTLGAGNHFLELQKVDKIYDREQAKGWGLHEEGQILIMLHCGSRGLGHQVATDYLAIQEKAVEKYGIKIADRQLACAPATSPEGQDFFSAMKCAVNYSFVNRLVMTQWIRETFERIFGKRWQEMEMKTIYGICHNIVKLERFGDKEYYVHRKGATRSYPGKPVLIAGSMGTASYLMVGTKEALVKTFGSSAHGAGRAMSRNAALKDFRGEKISRELAERGIITKAPSFQSLAEEAPLAYKDVDEVIESVHGAGISLKVARMVPIGVIKG